MIGKKVLKRQLKDFSRETRVCNFKAASSGLILFDASEEGVFPVIRDFRDELKKDGLNCSAYAFINEKEVPQEMLFWKDFHVMTRKDLNWFYRPKGEAAELYRDEEVDILLDFTRAYPLVIRHLVQPLRAGFKVGVFTEEENDYDLMIHLKPEEDIAYLAMQVKHYVSILNPSE